MPLSGWVKNIRKIIAFTFVRPIQRFNVVNRAQKYLGPDAKYFEPAPRAIGPMSEPGKKPIKYSHLTDGKGFKSVQRRRLEAIEKKELSTGDEQAKQMSDLSEAERFVVKVSSRLEVKKTLIDQQATKSLPAANKPKQIERGDVASGEDRTAQESHRPLPTMTSLQMSDPASIWVVSKTPVGRLNLDQLQEIMLNKIDDPDNYWTPEKIAEKYKIKPEYAASICKDIKHVRIHVPPKLAKLLDYTGRNDSIYQSSKHLVYIVDNELRSDEDKKYDEMYLPEDKLEEDVKQVVGNIERSQDRTSIDALRANFNRLKRQVEPLRISPLNRSPNPKLIEDHQTSRPIRKHLEAPKPSNNIST